MHVYDPTMNCNSEESTCSADELDFKFDVNSVLNTLKAAIKSTLEVIVVSNVEGQCDETTSTPKVFRLKRGMHRGAQTAWARRTRLTYSDDWKRVGAIAKESLAKLQDAYNIILNNKKKLITMEKLYDTEKTQKMFRQAYLKHSRSTRVKVKNSARSKAGREKSAHLNRWHSCMKI